MTTRRKLAAAATLAFGSITAFSACGTQGIQVAKTSPYYSGAVLFRDHCSGCHTLDMVGRVGLGDEHREPPAHQRAELQPAQEQYDAGHLRDPTTAASPGRSCPRTSSSATRRRQVAQFLTRYSGLKAVPVPTVNVSPEQAAVPPVPAVRSPRGPGSRGRDRAGSASSPR